MKHGKKLVGFWIALCVALGLVSWVDAAATWAADEVTLGGRITEEGSGRPIADILVGASRIAEIGGVDPGDEINVEKVFSTDKKGKFALTVSSSLAGLNEVIVFTGSDSHINKIYKDVPFSGRIPTGAAMKSAGIIKIDLTRDVKDINFSLKPMKSGKLTFMVAMRDGVRLATDVYLPQGEGPWPAILARTPYGKGNGGDIVRGVIRKGYAAVAQDMRGRFESGGEDTPFLSCGWGERQDGYDTVEWMAKQTWCNGKVGTFGGSALGITQNLMAGSRPPHLVCQYVAVATTSLYHHAAYPGGVFRKSQVEGWLKGNQFRPENLPLLISHPNYDDFWRLLDASTRHSVVKVPTLQLGGWYDTFSQGTINSFVGLQKNGAPGARGNQKLVMGPWTHGRFTKTKQGELTYPPNSKLPQKVADINRWFDFWLKGIDTGIMKEPAVMYYVMGDVDDSDAPGNEWRTSDVWPPPAKETPYYFHSGGVLNTLKPSPSEKPNSYTYDPRNPAPTRGGLNLTIPAGPMDQRPVEDRPDVLLFTSDVLEKPMAVTGPIKVYLWASSSAKDTDFAGKLTDVYPDGRSMLVIDGIIRARHRESLEEEKLMKPGEIYKFEIDLWSTSIVFNKGHRIRCAISSSNSPRFDPNPNTGDAFRANDKTQRAINTVYHDSEHHSHILLPIIEEE